MATRAWVDNVHGMLALLHTSIQDGQCVSLVAACRRHSSCRRVAAGLDFALYAE